MLVDHLGLPVLRRYSELLPSASETVLGAVAGVLLIALWALAGAIPGIAAEIDSDPRLSEAAQLIRQGEVSDAIELLKAVVASRPHDAEALLTLGSALSLVSRRNEAIEVLLRAIELSPEQARVHASAGAAFARLGEQDAALQVLQRAVALDAELGDAHLNIALILAAREQFERSAEHMTKALNLESDRGKLARLHFLTGKLHVERDDLERARGEFTRAIELDPTVGTAFLALGVTHKKLLMEDQALPMFRRAVELAPGDPAAHYQLGLELHRSGDADQAAEHLLRAHELEPDDRSIVYNLTRSLHKAGRRTDARRYREILDRMIESDDRARENELEAARLHGQAVRMEGAGNYAGALGVYREVLGFDPLNAVARRNLALVLCRLGRCNEGVEELDSILRINPDDAETARVRVIVMDRAWQQRSGEAGGNR